MSEELNEAYEALLREYHAADQAGSWRDRNVLAGLVDVLDMVKRIATVPGSHYRTSKVPELLQGALWVRREVFNNFADYVGTDIAADDMGTTVIDDVSRMAEAVEVEVTSALWSRAWGEPLYASRAEALCEAVAALWSWAQAERAAAPVDPEVI